MRSFRDEHYRLLSPFNMDDSCREVICNIAYVPKVHVESCRFKVGLEGHIP